MTIVPLVGEPGRKMDAVASKFSLVEMDATGSPSLMVGLSRNGFPNATEDWEIESVAGTPAGSEFVSTSSPALVLRICSSEPVRVAGPRWIGFRRQVGSHPLLSLIDFRISLPVTV